MILDWIIDSDFAMAIAPVVLAAAISAAGSMAGGLFGSGKSAKAGRKARALTQEQRKSNKDWYNRRTAEDYTSRSDYQKILNDQKDMLLKARKRDKATNVVAGGTDASEALAKEADNMAIAEAQSNQAANASSYKDSVEGSYRNMDAQMTQQMINSYTGQSGQIASATGQLVGAGLNLTGTLAGLSKSGNQAPASNSYKDASGSAHA